ncbi:MAG: hypothetical protein LDL01_02300 [Ignavibacterium sp.]|nr:hypothetical protein [Ignavibacterium sp.]
MLITVNTQAQIVIKEKVEINPAGEDIQNEYPVSSFDPCGNYPNQEYHQVVYSCSMYPIEPYQQLFPFQGGGSSSTFNSNRYYQIEIIEGSDYAYMEKVEYQDTFGVIHPREYLGSYLTGVKGNELSGTGEYMMLFDPGNPAIQRAGTYLRENPSLYYIHFDNYDQTEVNVTVKITDLDSNIVTYWYTTIVNPQLVIANQQLENDTVLHYYSKDVSLKLNNTKFPCLHPGYGGCPPDNVTFNIEITEGQQYGIIKNEETDETNTIFTGISWQELNSTIFTYYANGVQPDSAATVRIRHSSNDAEIPPMEFEFKVKRNTIPPPSEGGAIYIQLDKKLVMPSDTVNIYLKWINEIGDTLEFAPIQRFQIELAEGSEYGRMIDVESGQTGDNFNDAGREIKLIIEDNITEETAKITIVAQCDLLIWGGRIPINGAVKLREEEATERNKQKEPITPEFIIVGNHLIGVEEVIINKTPIVVEIIPEEISAGDTARIVVKKRQQDGSIVEFPAEQEFEIGMLEGCLLGKLSSGGTDTNYINGATQPIYFIADSSADSGLVKIRVGLKDSTTGNRSNKGGLQTEAGEYCFLNTFESVIYKDADVKVEKKYEILLGETKYYQARYLNGKLVIDELLGPNLWNGGLTYDVWGENPVTIVEGDKPGVGVYWEKEKPVWEGTTITGNLAKGLIRLVGRYWEEGKTYKVKLTARTQNGDEASIVIEVKKPSKLGNNIAWSKDVFGNDLNIDELCIKWSGKLGIPPQFIKGQMRRETSSHYPFYPTYLYEPWTTQFKAFKDDKSLITNPFFVQENTTTFNPTTPNHSNVKDYHYPTEPVSVWYMIENYSTIVHTSPPGGWRKYGERQATKNSSKEDGVLYFYGVYETPQSIYNKYKKEAYNKYKVKEYPLKEPLANNEARENFIKFFRDEWDGGVSGNRKGLKNIKAQTRIAASYGLLQLTYPTAIGGAVNYPINLENLPEELLETENIKWAFNLLTYYINDALKSQMDKNGNWQEGLEGTYLNRIWKSWNKFKPGYPEEVLRFSNNYKPGK